MRTRCPFASLAAEVVTLLTPFACSHTCTPAAGLPAVSTTSPSTPSGEESFTSTCPGTVAIVVFEEGPFGLTVTSYWPGSNPPTEKWPLESVNPELIRSASFWSSETVA